MPSRFLFIFVENLLENHVEKGRNLIENSHVDVSHAPIFSFKGKVPPEKWYVGYTTIVPYCQRIANKKSRNSLKKIFYYSSFVLMCFLLLACKNRSEYRVHDEFAVYVDRFEDEAARRGRNFDFPKTGLIVEFADLKNNTAGLCHYEKPIRIEIDKTYWDKMKRYAGSEQIHEELIFHELGHGILNRKHYNAMLENAEWKSLMCGGDSIEGRTWNINYRGIRRAYYLDELFYQNTPAPGYISTTFPLDVSEYTTIMQDNFDNPDAGIWGLGEKAKGSVFISNGRLVYKSSSPSNLIVISRINSVNVQSDFSLEFAMQYPGELETAKFGLAFGTTQTATSTESIDYFLINNKQEMFFGNNKWYSYFTKLTQEKIIPKGKNKLKVLKNKDMLYFFINDAYVYCTEIENKQNGYSFGFMVPAYETLYLDDLKITSNDKYAASAILQKVMEKSVFEFETITTEITETYRQK